MKLTILEKKLLGYRSRAEFVAEAVRDKLVQVKKSYFLFSRSSFSGLSAALRCCLREILVYELVLEFLALISWVFSILSLIAHSMNC